MNSHRLFVALVFMFGCATGSIASHTFAPPASAAEPVQTWEYTCVRAANEGADVIAAMLNNAGKNGWEFAGYVSSSACLKRPLR